MADSLEDFANSLSPGQYINENKEVNNMNLKFPEMTCRKCNIQNPLIYFAPVCHGGMGTCVCFECANERKWLDSGGALKKGITL